MLAAGLKFQMCLLNKDLKGVRELAMHLYGRKILQARGRTNAKTQSESMPRHSRNIKEAGMAGLKRMGAGE